MKKKSSTHNVYLIIIVTYDFIFTLGFVRKCQIWNQYHILEFLIIQSIVVGGAYKLSHILYEHTPSPSLIMLLKTTLWSQAWGLLPLQQQLEVLFEKKIIFGGVCYIYFIMMYRKVDWHSQYYLGFSIGLMANLPTAKWFTNFINKCYSYSIHMIIFFYAF